jgi:pyruvate kinase
MNFDIEKECSTIQTKIVATIGPASMDESVLVRMIESGMTVARLNFSHGSYETHEKVIEMVRKVSAEEGRPVAILLDLSGPKIRLTEMDEPLEVKRDQTIRLGVVESAEADIYTGFSQLVEVVNAGDTILIDDGYIELKVDAVEERVLVCTVMTEGLIKSRKGINLPDLSVTIPVFTDKDKRDLQFGLAHDIDLVAMSFVDDGSNIEPIRHLMRKVGKKIPVIAKVERPRALANIDGIVEAFDGIMIARGDLGVEVAPERVPLIQKELIQKANRENKLVITATQMLESMIENPRPTRAEASDVSNAILDGSDAVMLSGETAVGKYPARAVDMMRRIACRTEKSDLYRHRWLERKAVHHNHTEAIVKSAAEISSTLGARYILVFSFSGVTALLLSKFRPCCPIIAFTPNEEVVRRMAAYWGVIPQRMDFTAHTDEMILRGEELLEARGLVDDGDLVVTVAGVTPMRGASNMLRISEIQRD